MDSYRVTSAIKVNGRVYAEGEIVELGPEDAARLHVTPSGAAGDAGAPVASAAADGVDADLESANRAIDKAFALADYAQAAASSQVEKPEAAPSAAAGHAERPNGIEAGEQAEKLRAALDKRTVKELRAIAEADGVDLPAKANKAELIELLINAGAKG